MHYLDRLLDERTSLTGVMTGLRDRAAAEERDLTDGERSEISRLQERCVVVDGLRIDVLAGELDAETRAGGGAGHLLANAPFALLEELGLVNSFHGCDLD